MAPKTPQGNKSPRAPPTEGPTPMTPGIPAPGSVLQRRSFMPAPSTSASKSYQSMSMDQQSLLVEAISVQSPGLIDPNRKRPESVESDTSAPGTPQYQSFPPGHNGASPLSYRSLQSRRTSAISIPEGSAMTTTTTTTSTNGQHPSSHIRTANTGYSAISPLTTSTPSSISDSPSGPRSLRMSSGLSMGAPSTSASTSTSTSTTRLVKQPQFQRPTSAGSSGIASVPRSMMMTQGPNGATTTTPTTTGVSPGTLESPPVQPK
ncbi:hypothetical protein BGZ65_008900, partial [Modicella reniformis]